MRLDTVQMIAKSLCAHFERRFPATATLQSWRDTLANLPDEPASWIVEKIRSTEETWPRNLPLVVKRFYGDWLHSHPNRFADMTSQAGCNECEDGYLFVWSPEDVSCMFACRRCNQQPGRIPVATLGQLLAAGYTPNDLFNNQERYSTRRPASTYHSPNEVAAATAERISFDPAVQA